MPREKRWASGMRAAPEPEMGEHRIAPARVSRMRRGRVVESTRRIDIELVRLRDKVPYRTTARPKSV
jgi:hypothetical protein